MSALPSICVSSENKEAKDRLGTATVGLSLFLAGVFVHNVTLKL